MTTALATSPFTAAYTRLTGLGAALPGIARVTEEAPRGGPGWVTGRQLAGGGPALDAFLAWDARQALREHGRPARPDVVATFGLHRYAWPVALLFTVPWFLHRRVPLLPCDAVAYHRDEEWLTVRPHGFVCLPDDPAADLPGARVAGGEEEVRAALRTAVAAHLGPVLRAFRPRMRRGPHALWGMVTDEIAEGLWYAGHLFGEEERAVRDLAGLLPGGTPPLTAGARFRTLTGPGGSPLRTRDRATCCLYYTLRPDATCVTCPRTCDADRVAQLAPSD